MLNDSEGFNIFLLFVFFKKFYFDPDSDPEYLKSLIWIRIQKKPLQIRHTAGKKYFNRQLKNIFLSCSPFSTLFHQNETC